jgi:muramoyltetrapeptide carboxypeptidase
MKNNAPFKYIQLIGLFILLISVYGCTLKNRSTNPYNAILENAEFLELLNKHAIIVVAPASGISIERLAELEALKLSIKIPVGLLSPSIVFHANSDENRFNLLKTALLDDANDIIWSLRGGYGAARLMERMYTLPKPKKEKWFVGYSDMTALHLFLTQEWNWKTVHGAMALELLAVKRDPSNFKTLAQLIDKKIDTIKIRNLKPLNINAQQIKQVFGPLTGGNLSIVQTSIGTPWQIKTENKILFLEDTGEKGYGVDRALNHLKQAGLLKHVKAIVFGDFGGADGLSDLALNRFAADINIPVYKTDQFGHDSANVPLIYNTFSYIRPFNRDPKDLNFELVMNVKQKS